MAKAGFDVSAFTLDPRLEADTLALGDTPLSRLLLMNDARFVWLILVPRREGLTELFDLIPVERAAFIEEIAAISSVLSKRRDIDKINVGALGNIVRQLHVHIVGRTHGDAAWPGPVWGFETRLPYDRDAKEKISQELAQSLVHILTDKPRLARA
jgi:diadenosine tetraphosphate (Ap4A) HIT family hydrolase